MPAQDPIASVGKPNSPARPEIVDIELRLLLEALYQRFGYDFRDYSQAHIKRRVLRRVVLEGLPSVSELQHRMLRDEELLNLLLGDLSISTTEMFRDPGFYRAFRERVVPVLRTYPSFCIWHAGCATGEEVYSMAILLAEEGLYDRARIYATDMCEPAVAAAAEGIYPLDRMKEYSTNYHKAGGTGSLSEYYSVQYGSVAFRSSLRDPIVFATHNLVTDSVFREVEVVICRNVLIYFNRSLQTRVTTLFAQSLCRRGFLCLGTKESLLYSGHTSAFEALSPHANIFRKLQGTPA